jgi:hypothetical protein
VALALAPVLPLAAAASGCEALVGNQIAYTCTDSDPLSCPSGKVCATATGQCIPVGKSCLQNTCAAGQSCDPGTLQCVVGATDASAADTGPIVTPEAGSDTGPGMDSGNVGPPYGTGHVCGKPSDCTSAICADSALLGMFYNGKIGAVCTVPCCTSEQCGAGLVCIGPGTGGHYCVPASAIGRTPGSSAGGATCALDRDCRSGKCVGDSGGLNKVCADSCCSDANCGGGPAKCRPMDVDTSGHKAFTCSSVGGSTTFCSSPFDSCASGVCTNANTCESPCCGVATISPGSITCTGLPVGNGDTFNFSNGGTVGTGALGATCKLGTACLSGYCDKADGATTSTSGACSDYCCVDTDCGAGFVCQPRTGLTHFLRCVPQ